MTRNLMAWTVEQGIDKATKRFESTYAMAPSGVWAAPGRVNLIGEHVDYNGGPCLPIALPHATYVAASKREDRLLRMVSGQESGIKEVELDQIGPGKVSGWPAYVAGVVWALEQAGYELGGFDLAIESCVPYGAGLSSSAALEAAVALAVCELSGLEISDPQLRAQIVKCCIRAENEIAGANTGGLDQTASILSEAGNALYVDFYRDQRANIPFDLAQQNLSLLVIDTCAPHSLNDGQYAARRETCEQAAAHLGVKCLAEVTDPEAALAQLADQDPEMIARVRHVLTEIERTLAAVKVMQSGSLEGEQLEKIAQLFDASHDSLRDDYQVTCQELDLAVDTARACGSHGARMTGGGFGGSAIAIIESDQVPAVQEAISQAFAEAGLNEPQFLSAYAASPARRVA